MSWAPQLNVMCGRCGKPRTGLRHDCVSNSRRSATVRPQLTFGKCQKCGKPQGNPLTHACAPKSGFKRRKSAAAKREKAKARKKRQAEKHDYQACQDQDCPRPLCVAHKTGYKRGYDEGYGDGFSTGFEMGFEAGQEACPRPHSG